MSVIEFHIWPEDNPVGEGNKLGVITDEDVVADEGGPAIWYEPSLHGLGGSAGFSISRHSPLATSTIIREDNFVRVKTPEVSSGYLPFGWWMKSGQFHLIDSDEAGGENITIEGPGLLHKLATGSLYHSSTVSDQPARGSADRDGLWWWINEPYGAMLTRAFEEGRHSPFPDPAEAGSPLEFFDITFSRTVDSAAVAWPNIDGEFQVDIGTDLMTLCDRLRESGNLYVIGDASDVDSIQVHCFQTYGDDLTGSFAADTVRFEKAVNIATELVRTSEAGLRMNKLLLRDSDGSYSTETLPGFIAGDVERWGFWDASQTNDDDLLNAIGQNVLAAAQTAVEPVGFEQPPGKDPTNGLYLPALHYKEGDTVTLHTGTDPEDYNEADQLVVAYRVSVREGTTDDTAVRAQRSLTIEPQLNYYSPRYGNSNVGEGPMGVPGCKCPRPCSALTPGTESLFRFYMSSNAGAADPAAHGGWDVDSSGGGTNTIKTTADGTYPASGTGNTSSAGGDADGRNVLYWAGMSDANIGSSLAAVLAAGGATVRGQWAVRARFGIGISESSQHMISNFAIRVAQGATTTIRGTAYAPHTVATPAGATEWPPQSAHINRRFPPVMASDTLSAVSGTVSTDRLVLELGSRNYTLVTSGGAIMLTSDDAADLPEDESTGVGPNAWFEIRAISAPTGSGHHPDLVGTDRDYARCDHTHHVLANRDPSTADDITQGYPTTTLWTNTETHQSFVLVDEDTGDWQPFATAGDHTHDASEIIGLPDGTSIVVDHGSMGATETFDFADGSDHEGVLDANLTVTLAGATVGEAAWMTLVLTQDSGGGNTITLPVEVANATDLETAFDQTADAVNVLTLFTYDGGTVWYGFLAGGSGSGSVTEEDVRDAGRWEVLMADGVSSPPDPLTNEAGTDWLYGWVSG